MQIRGERREVEVSHTLTPKTDIEYSGPTASASAACEQPLCVLLRPLLLSGKSD